MHIERVVLKPPKSHIAPDRQAVKQGAILKQHADIGVNMCAVASRQADRLCSVNMYRAAIGRQKTQNGFQHDRFAAARPAYHHHRLTLFNVQVNALQHLFGTEGFGDTCKGYHTGHAENRSDVIR